MNIDNLCPIRLYSLFNGFFFLPSTNIYTIPLICLRCERSGLVLGIISLPLSPELCCERTMRSSGCPQTSATVWTHEWKRFRKHGAFVCKLFCVSSCRQSEPISHTRTSLLLAFVATMASMKCAKIALHFQSGNCLINKKKNVDRSTPRINDTEIIAHMEKNCC